MISQCAAEIRERIEQAVDEVAHNEWFALTDRLHETINDVIDQAPPPHPELRRQSS